MADVVASPSIPYYPYSSISISTNAPLSSAIYQLSAVSHRPLASDICKNQVYGYVCLLQEPWILLTHIVNSRRISRSL